MLVANEVAEGKKLFENAHKIYSEKLNTSGKDNKEDNINAFDESEI